MWKTACSSKPPSSLLEPDTFRRLLHLTRGENALIKHVVGLLHLTHVVGLRQQDMWWDSSNKTRGETAPTTHVVGLLQQHMWRDCSNNTCGRTAPVNTCGGTAQIKTYGGTAPTTHVVGLLQSTHKYADWDCSNQHISMLTGAGTR